MLKQASNDEISGATLRMECCQVQPGLYKGVPILRNATGQFTDLVLNRGHFQDGQSQLVPVSPISWDRFPAITCSRVMPPRGNRVLKVLAC